MRRLVRVLSRRSDVHGVPVFDFLGTGREDPSFRPKLGEAMALLAAHDQRTLDRLRRLTVGVVLFDHPRLYGSWNAASGEIRLSPSTFARSPATELASTIVHEATHAWLCALGFGDRQDRRHRIESICYRREAAFARRVPGGGELAELYDICASNALAEGPAAYSPRARRELDLQALADLGAPSWVIRLLGSIVRRGSA